MAVNFISNRKNTAAVIHVSSANATLVVAGNSSVSNVAMSDEVLTGAYISQVAWGCDPSGYIVVKRGSVVASVYDSTGQHEYAGCGMPITVGQSDNLTIEFVGSSNCFIVMDIQKVGDFTSEYFQN